MRSNHPKVWDRALICADAPRLFVLELIHSGLCTQKRDFARHFLAGDHLWALAHELQGLGFVSVAKGHLQLTQAAAEALGLPPTGEPPRLHASITTLDEPPTDAPARPSTAPPSSEPQAGARDTGLDETVYAHLRAIAQRQIAGNRSDSPLKADDLVGEAYARLSPKGDFNDKAQFYAAAAQAMRRILIDHARRLGAKKRGDKTGFAGIANVADLARDDQADAVLELERAYSQLEQEDAEAAGVVRLRFYAGLTNDQTAEVLGISPRQADRAWAFARAFLAAHIRRKNDGAAPTDRRDSRSEHI